MRKPVRAPAEGGGNEKAISSLDSIVLCFSPADAEFARRLADYLETNVPYAVSREEGLMRPDFDLVDAAEFALSARVALVLLSPHSVPKQWPRERWEPVFSQQAEQFQTQFGFVRLAECKFPELFRRGYFFDASTDFLTAARSIKSWLLRPLATSRSITRSDPSLEELRRALADQPAAREMPAAIAVQFEKSCAHDFEAVYRFDFARRSRAGMLGDIVSALGLSQTGRMDENRTALLEWAAGHRALLVLAGVKPEDRDFISPGGRTSVIFTGAPLSDSIASAAAEFVRRFEDAGSHDPATSLRLGWEAVSLLKKQGRFSEVSEVLDAMLELTRGDRSAALRIEREQYWMQVHQGNADIGLNTVFSPGREQQLSLPFAE